MPPSAAVEGKILKMAEDVAGIKVAVESQGERLVRLENRIEKVEQAVSSNRMGLGKMMAWAAGFSVAAGVIWGLVRFLVE